MMGSKDANRIARMHHAAGSTRYKKLVKQIDTAALNERKKYIEVATIALRYVEPGPDRDKLLELL